MLMLLATDSSSSASRDASGLSDVSFGHIETLMIISIFLKH
jgi:hypothetical protein